MPDACRCENPESLLLQGSVHVWVVRAGVCRSRGLARSISVALHKDEEVVVVVVWCICVPVAAVLSP